MLYQACRSLKVPVPPLYPVRGASNYTLLYLIFRILTELPVRKALELGAGQSSLLIDAVAKIQPTLDAVTLETEADWAGRIRNRVAHQIVQSSLQQIKHDGDLVTSYTDLEQLGGRNFDLVVVDGPRGNRRKSRWAALEVLERYLASEFVVIFDDAERGGEQDTIQAFMERHTGCVDFWMLHGKNSQFVAFTPCYGAVKYF
jgi:predicted O-methyltransferase YrrM